MDKKNIIRNPNIYFVYPRKSDSVKGIERTHAYFTCWSDLSNVIWQTEWKATHQLQHGLHCFTQLYTKHAKNGKTANFKGAGIFCEWCNNSIHHQPVRIITFGSLWIKFIAQFTSIQRCRIRILYNIFGCISCRLCEIDRG